MDSLLNNGKNEHVEDDTDVTAPSDLFTLDDSNSLNEPAVDDQKQQSNEDIEEGIENEVNTLGEEDDNVLLEDTMDIGTDGAVDTVDEGTETDELDIFDPETDSNEDTNEADDSDSLNLLGDDWDDLSSPGKQIDKAEHDNTVSGEEDDQEDLLNKDNEEGEDEEDETVDQTWDMTGDEVDDDQANNSVNTLLEAGDEGVYTDDENNDDDDIMQNELEEAQHSNDDAIDENGEYNEDGQQDWNNEDDTEAELEEQEETMEQGTVEENDNDRTGSTLEQALDALEEKLESDTASSVLVDSDDLTSSSPVTDNTLPYGSSGKYDLPTQGETISSTTTEQDATGDLATVDTSLLLLIAVLILVCLRLPYVKRFFVKLFKTQDTSSTLPYHTVPNKELD